MLVSGADCSVDIDECALHHGHCDLNGTVMCHDALNDFFCECRAGYINQNCSVSSDSLHFVSDRNRTYLY